jgi:hypothetical protein
MTSQPYWRCWPRVADPRHRRGVRHRLAVILGLALCAVVAGARSFTATAEWAADADEQTPYMLRTGSRVPSGNRRRTLQRLDADTFDLNHPDDAASAGDALSDQGAASRAAAAG